MGQPVLSFTTCWLRSSYNNLCCLNAINVGITWYVRPTVIDACIMHGDLVTWWRWWIWSTQKIFTTVEQYSTLPANIKEYSRTVNMSVYFIFTTIYILCTTLQLNMISDYSVALNDVSWIIVLWCHPHCLSFARSAFPQISFVFISVVWKQIWRRCFGSLMRWFLIAGYLEPFHFVFS